MNKEVNMNIDFSKTEEVKCNDCNGEHFEIVYSLRTISKFNSPTGEETVIPFQEWRCASCGSILNLNDNE